MRLRLMENEEGVDIALAHADNDPWDSVAVISNPAAMDSIINSKLTMVEPAILPPAIRYISPDRSIVMWERPPGYVSFNYTGTNQGDLRSDQKSKFRFRLPLPWQRYVVKLSAENRVVNLFMFFGKEQLQSLDEDPLYAPPILNFYDSCRLCPAAYVNAPDYGPSLFDVMNFVYTTIWYSGFNIDTFRVLYTMSRNSSLGRGENDRLYNAVRRYYSDQKFHLLYKFWSAMRLEDIVQQNLHPVYASFNQFLASGEAEYNYSGPNNDYLVELVLAAQDAQ